VNDKGESCLHVSKTGQEFLELMLENGADMSLKNKEGDTPLISHMKVRLVIP